MISAGAPFDKFAIPDIRRFTSHPAGSYFYPIQSDPSGRTQVSSVLVEGESTAVIWIDGQSNSANHSGGAHAATSPKAQNFNYSNGGVYLAADPLLGNTGPAGSYATFLADRLISAGEYQRVILAPMAINATLASDYAVGGIFEQNTRVMCRRLLAAGLPPTMILRQQGESDNVEGTSAATITASIRSWVEVIRSEGINAPVFIALTSTWPGYSNNAQVRLGQANAVSAPLGIYLGPDTDTIGAGGREGDGVHFNASGSDQHAALWQAVIAAHF